MESTELFQLFGSIAIRNADALRAIEETTNQAQEADAVIGSDKHIRVNAAQAVRTMQETQTTAKSSGDAMEQSLQATAEVHTEDAEAAMETAAGTSERTGNRIAEACRKIGASISKAYEEDSYTRVDSALQKLGRTVLSQSDALQTLKERYNTVAYEQGEASEEAQRLAGKIQTLSGALLDSRGSLEKASTAADKFDATMQRAEQRTESFEDALEQQGEAAQNAEHRTEGFRQELGNAAGASERAESRMSDAFKKIGAAVSIAFSVDKIKDFSVSCLNASADAQAMESQFSQVFGTMEQHAASSLTAIAQDSGIAENRLKSSYAQIAAFAKAAGMDTGDALALASRAMAAVADSAAFYDRSLEDTTESLQSFLKGNFENDAALGLSATETTRNAKAMELYGASFKELSETQKQLTLLAMVEDANKLSGAMGQASRESDTWSNQTGNLRQSWKDLQASIGDKFLDKAIYGVKTLSEWLDDLEEPIGRVIDAVETYGKPLFDTIIDAIGDIREGWDAASPALQSGLWEGFLKPIATWTADAALTGIEYLGDLCKSLGESLTEKDVQLLIDLGIAIGGLWLTLKGYQAISGLAANIRLAIPQVQAAITALGTGVELSLGTVFGVIGAAIAGWQVGTMIRDAIGGENVDEAVWDFCDAWLLGLDEIVKGAKDAAAEIKSLLFGSGMSGAFSGSSATVSSAVTSRRIRSGVDWHAKGAILTEPTIFDYNPATGRYQGGGEAGAEAVAPIDVLLGYVRTAVSEQNAGNQAALTSLLHLMEQYLPQLLAGMQRSVVLSTGETVGALTPYIDEELGVLHAMKGRG